MLLDAHCTDKEGPWVVPVKSKQWLHGVRCTSEPWQCADCTCSTIACVWSWPRATDIRLPLTCLNHIVLSHAMAKLTNIETTALVCELSKRMTDIWTSVRPCASAPTLFAGKASVIFRSCFFGIWARLTSSNFVLLALYVAMRLERGICRTDDQCWRKYFPLKQEHK